MRELVKESLNFIRNNLSDKGIIFVGFSGGKDSIVTADLMKRSGVPYRLYYSATGIDPPDVVRFIRREYPACEFLKPNKTFWHGILTKNPPAKFSRWCCFKLKKEPSFRISINHRVFGIRAEESGNRAKYKQIEAHSKKGHIHYHPILNLTEGNIWEYIEKRGLSYPDLYDQGLSRLGCVVCPYHCAGNGAGHNFYKNHWPRFFDLFEKKCHEWFEKRQGQGREMFFDTPEEFIENWYKGNAQWYKRNKKQIK